MDFQKIFSKWIIIGCIFLLFKSWSTVPINLQRMFKAPYLTSRSNLILPQDFLWNVSQCLNAQNTYLWEGRDILNKIAHFINLWIKIIFYKLCTRLSNVYNISFVLWVVEKTLCWPFSLEISGAIKKIVLWEMRVGLRSG